MRAPFRSIALVVIVWRLEEQKQSITKQKQTSQLTCGNDVQLSFGNDVHCRASFSFDFFAANFW